jgi:hypothetical protein
MRALCDCFTRPIVFLRPEADLSHKVENGFDEWRLVMSTMTLGQLRGQPRREERAEGRPKALRLTILLGTLILMAVTVNALIIAADSKFRQRTPVSPPVESLG